MDHRALVFRARQVGRSLTLLALLFLLASPAHAQGPQFDVGSPPGAAGGSSAVGQPLGAAAFPEFGSPSSVPFSGRRASAGSSRPRQPACRAPGAPVFRTSKVPRRRSPKMRPAVASSPDWRSGAPRRVR